MALSNWDTLAIGNDGKSLPSGMSKFGDTVEIEIYKNHAYIHSKELWKKGNGYTEPVIGSILEGNIELLDLQINAKSGKQSSIYIFAHCGYNETYKAFAGIGCYGFGDRTNEFLKTKGITPPNEEDGYWSSLYDNGKEYLCFDNIKDDTKSLKIRRNKKFELYPWVGVERETLEDFKDWLKGMEPDKKWLNSIDWENLYRFNQGDAYIANHVGAEMPKSSVGSPEEPILIKTLKP